MTSPALLVALIVAVAALPARVSAQQADVVVTLGRGWPGSDGSVVRWNGKRRVEGVHVGYWWSPRFETAIHFSRAHLPPPGVTSYFVGCSPASPPDCVAQRVGVIFARRSPRRYWTAVFLRHFGAGQRVRPFVGGGIGSMDLTVDPRCEQQGCEPLLGFSLETRRSSAFDPVAIAGVNVAIARMLFLQTAVRFHRPFGEDLSLLETSLGLGIRFRRSR